MIWVLAEDDNPDFMEGGLVKGIKDQWAGRENRVSFRFGFRKVILDLREVGFRKFTRELLLPGCFNFYRRRIYMNDRHSRLILNFVTPSGIEPETYALEER